MMRMKREMYVRRVRNGRNWVCVCVCAIEHVVVAAATAADSNEANIEKSTQFVTLGT